MLNKLRLWLRAVCFKSRMENELEDELRFHLEKEIERNIARGMSSEEARYAAVLAERKRSRQTHSWK